MVTFSANPVPSKRDIRSTFVRSVILTRVPLGKVKLISLMFGKVKPGVGDGDASSDPCLLRPLTGVGVGVAAAILVKFKLEKLLNPKTFPNVPLKISERGVEELTPEVFDVALGRKKGMSASTVVLS